ncbi:MAG: peptidylprolyl isomerase [Pseudomonadota bacterium]
MGKTATLFGALSLVLSTSFTASAQDADQVLAKIGEIEITLGNIIALKTRLPQNYQQIPNSELLDGIMEQLISQAALAQTADAKETRLVTSVLANERLALLAQESLRSVREAPVTEAEIEAFYAAEFEGFVGSQEFNASHILVDSEDEAKEIVTALDSGADFADLAREKSTGPSGPNGGQLGWFGMGQMVPEFENAVVELADGAISAPIQTQFGWHVIIRNDSRSTEAPSLDSVRSDIEAEILRTRINDAVTAATEATTITRNYSDLDPNVLDRTDLISE